MKKGINFKQKDDINIRIKKLRSFLRLPRSYFEITHNLSKETLKKWETEDYKIKESSIEKILRIFKKEGVIVSKEWLKYGSGPEPFFNPPEKEIPLKKGHNFLLEDNIPEEIRTAREAEIICNFYRDTVHFYVTDESMMPIYPMDCCVIGRKKNLYEEMVLEVGKDCIVKIKDYENPIFRRLFLEKEGSFSLYIINCAESVSNTPPIISNAEIEYIAPVKWIIK